VLLLPEPLTSQGMPVLGCLHRRLMYAAVPVEGSAGTVSGTSVANRSSLAILHEQG